MNASRPSFARSVRLGSVAALTALALLTPGLAAQDDEAEVHPAHIHSGSCAELGDVVVSADRYHPNRRRRRTDRCGLRHSSRRAASPSLTCRCRISSTAAMPSTSTSAPTRLVHTSLAVTSAAPSPLTRENRTRAHHRIGRAQRFRAHRYRLARRRRRPDPGSRLPRRAGQRRWRRRRSSSGGHTGRGRMPAALSCAQRGIPCRRDQGFCLQPT